MADDDDILKKVFCDERREEIATNADPNIVLYAFRQRPSSDGYKARSQLSSAVPTRPVKEAHGNSSYSSKKHSDKPCQQVEPWNAGDYTPGSGRSTGRVISPKIATLVAAAEARDFAAAVSSNIPRSQTAAAPHPTVAGARRRSSGSEAPKACTQRDWRIRYAENPPVSQGSLLDQPIRGAAGRPLLWRRRMRALATEAVDGYRRRNLTDDIIRRPDGDVPGSRNGVNGTTVLRRTRTSSYTILSRKEPDEVLARSKHRPDNDVVRSSKDGPEGSRGRSRKRPDEEVGICSKSDQQEVIDRSNSGSDNDKAASLADRETSRKLCALRKRKSERSRNQTTTTAFSASGRRCKSHDRYQGLLSECPSVINVSQNRHVDPSDLDSDEPERGKPATTRIKERVEGPETREEQLTAFQLVRLDPRHLESPVELRRIFNMLRRSCCEDVTLVEGETGDGTHAGGHEEAAYTDGEEERSLFDPLVHWKDGPSCEQLILTESDPEPTENDDVMLSTEERDPTSEDAPEQAIIHVAPQRLLMSAERWIPNTLVQLPTQPNPPKTLATLVRRPDERRSRFFVFRALTALNRNLRSTDRSDGVGLPDQRVMIAVIVVLIVLVVCQLVTQDRFPRRQ